MVSCSASTVTVQFVECRGEQIRAANSLLSIIHSMKLLLLISDESQIVSRRDAEFKIAQEEKEETKKKVAALLTELLHPPGDTAASSQGSD